MYLVFYKLVDGGKNIIYSNKIFFHKKKLITTWIAIDSISTLTTSFLTTNSCKIVLTRTFTKLYKTSFGRDLLRII